MKELETNKIQIDKVPKQQKQIKNSSFVSIANIEDNSHYNNSNKKSSRVEY